MEYLSLSNNDLGDDWIPPLMAQLSSQSELQILKLSGTKITYKSMIHIRNFVMHHEKLIGLSLARNPGLCDNGQLDELAKNLMRMGTVIQHRLRVIDVNSTNAEYIHAGFCLMNIEVESRNNNHWPSLLLPTGYLGGIIPNDVLQNLDLAFLLLTLATMVTVGILGPEYMQLALIPVAIPLCVLLYIAMLSRFKNYDSGLLEQHWHERQILEGHDRVHKWGFANCLAVFNLFVDFFQLCSFSFRTGGGWPTWITDLTGWFNFNPLFQHPEDRWFTIMLLCMVSGLYRWLFNLWSNDNIKSVSGMVHLAEKLNKDKRGDLEKIWLTFTGALFLPLMSRAFSMLAPLPKEAIAKVTMWNHIFAATVPGYILLFLVLYIVFGPLINAVKQEHEEELDIRFQTRFVIRLGLVKTLVASLKAIFPTITIGYMICLTFCTVFLMWNSFRRSPCSVPVFGMWQNISVCAVLTTNVASLIFISGGIGDDSSMITIAVVVIIVLLFCIGIVLQLAMKKPKQADKDRSEKIRERRSEEHELITKHMLPRYFNHRPLDLHFDGDIGRRATSISVIIFSPLIMIFGILSLSTEFGALQTICSGPVLATTLLSCLACFLGIIGFWNQLIMNDLQSHYKKGLEGQIEMGSPFLTGIFVVQFLVVCSYCIFSAWTPCNLDAFPILSVVTIVLVTFQSLFAGAYFLFLRTRTDQ